MASRTSKATNARLSIGVYSKDKVERTYEEVMIELGDNAPYIAKSRIVEIVSNKVGLSKDSVWRLLKGVDSRKLNRDSIKSIINETYGQVLYELGDNAPYISKSRIYALIASKLSITEDRVRKSFLKHNTNKQNDE